LNTGDKGNLYVPRAGIWNKLNTWLEPDFFYVTANTEARLDGKYHTNADLVVEVISPGSAIYDRNTKADTYAALGIKELWLVDEFSGLIEVRVLKVDAYESSVFEREDRLTSTVLPGLAFQVAEVFED
jgi:Uma2 family endonuclease